MPAGFCPAYNGLGVLLNLQGRLPEAIACYRRAIDLKPDFPDAHLNLALVCLLQGEFAEGWRHTSGDYISPACRSTSANEFAGAASIDGTIRAVAKRTRPR